MPTYQLNVHSSCANHLVYEKLGQAPARSPLFQPFSPKMPGAITHFVIIGHPRSHARLAVDSR